MAARKGKKGAIRSVRKAYAPGEERRQKLIESAERLLTKKRITEVSYSDIAEDAGLPMSSCYHFYKDKQHLLQALSEHLGDRYRAEVVGAYKEDWKFGMWRDLLDDHFDRSLQFLQRYPASRQIWYSQHTPPVIRARTMERDRSLALSFRPLFEMYFTLPDLPNLDEVFVVAKEIRDKIVAYSFQEEGDLLFYRREAKRATKAYLDCYLPKVLPPRGK